MSMNRRWVMLVPLGVLAAGALFAGMLGEGIFVGAENAEFWKTAIFVGPANHILEAMHHVSLWIGILPTVAMVLGFVVAVYFYLVQPEAAAHARRAERVALPVPSQQVVLRRALRLPVRAPGLLARPLPLEEGRRLVHRRLRAGRRLGLGARRHPARRAAPVRLPLPLCLRHADRHRRHRHLHAVRRTDHDRLADPLHRHLPAAGRRAARPHHSRRRSRGAAERLLHRAVDDARHLRPLALHLVRLRRQRARLPDGRACRPGSAAASATPWASTASRCPSSS